MANGQQQQDVRDRILGQTQRELKAKEKTVNQLVGQLEKANRRIAELEKELGKSPTTRLDEPFFGGSRREKARPTRKGKEAAQETQEPEGTGDDRRQAGAGRENRISLS